MDDDLFGEGLALHNDKLYQLTYRSGVAIVYDKEFNELKRHKYSGEGWGLTSDGRHLLMSNGKSTISFRDPETFEEDRAISVRLGNRRLYGINELEYVGGKLYANRWHDDSIYIVNPENGDVTGKIELGDILSWQERGSREAVLNGIALNTDTNRLLVTGKLWPKLFEIDLVPIDDQ